MENDEVGGRKIGEKVNAVGRKLVQKSVLIESLRRLGADPEGCQPHKLAWPLCMDYKSVLVRLRPV